MTKISSLLPGYQFILEHARQIVDVLVQRGEEVLELVWEAAGRAGRRGRRAAAQWHSARRRAALMITVPGHRRRRRHRRPDAIPPRSFKA